VHEPNYQLWRQRHEQMLQDAENGRLVWELRAARRRAYSRPGGRDGGVMGRIAGKAFAMLWVPGEKARC
jgi:hypothetical protein